MTSVAPTAPTAPAVPVGPRRSRPVAFLVGVAVSGVAAVAGGLAAGHAVYTSRPPSTDPWSDLGAALLAVPVGCVVGGALYLAGVVVTVRRAVAPGRRWRAALAVVAATCLGGVLAVSAAESGRAGGVPVLGGVVAVAVLAGAAAGVGNVVGAVDGRTAARTGAVAAVGWLVVAGVAGVRADGVADAGRAERYERTGAPLALVGGRDLSVPAGGWRLESVSEGWFADDVTVTFDVPDGDAGRGGWVTLTMDGDPDPRPCERVPEGGAGACAALGRRDGGAEILGERTAGGIGAGYQVVWVDVAGGRWSLQGTDVPQPVDAEAAVATLTALEPVDADTFAAAT